MKIPYNEELRPDTGLYNAKLGIWLFLASEVMLFGGLFSAYIMLRLSDTNWANYGQSALNVPLATLNTAVLITSRRKDVSFYDTTSRAVQMLLQSTIGKCREKDVDLLAKEIMDSASEKENNRECFYISQIYLKLKKQKKADKFQKLCKKGLLKTAEKISDPKNMFLPYF